jgi:hypothetical protein
LLPLDYGFSEFSPESPADPSKLSRPGIQDKPGLAKPSSLISRLARKSVRQGSLSM